MSPLKAERYITGPSSSFPLKVLANRYYLSHSPTLPAPQERSKLTLVFVHAIGAHKEVWEVTIEALLLKAHEKGLPIADVFSIESPNHGESAIVNEEAIKVYFQDRWPTRALSSAIHTFMTAGPEKGGYDFSNRRLVGIAHSIGAPALFLMHELEPQVKLESYIAIEPGISLKNNPHTNASSQALTAWTWLRPDVWPSRRAAKKSLSNSIVHATWDERVLDLFIKHGLRTHPASKYHDPFSFNGVCTALTKEQEAASYRSDELVVDGLEAFSTISRVKPVHLIWGTVNDVKTPELRDLLADKSAGRTPASVTLIEEAGHLVVQQQPIAVADTLFDILWSTFHSGSQEQTKL